MVEFIRNQPLSIRARELLRAAESSRLRFIEPLLLYAEDRVDFFRQFLQNVVLTRKLQLRHRSQPNGI